MKREFKVKCTYENEYLVKTIIDKFNKCMPVRHAFVRGIEDGCIFIKFKCVKRKLKECRLVLGRMLNEGMLLGVEETW